VTLSRRYLLISPCRDEARYSVARSTGWQRSRVPPALWVVVDDGSTDARPRSFLRSTPADCPACSWCGAPIATAPSWARRRRRLRRWPGEGTPGGLRLPVQAGHGPGAAAPLLRVANAADGERPSQSELPPASPGFVHPKSGTLVPEGCEDEMPVCVTKFYRVACFNEIGRFVGQIMWEGIDCHRCRHWIAESVDLEPIRFVHLRPQGASQRAFGLSGFGLGFGGTLWAHPDGVILPRSDLSGADS